VAGIRIQTLEARHCPCTTWCLAYLSLELSLTSSSLSFSYCRCLIVHSLPTTFPSLLASAPPPPPTTTMFRGRGRGGVTAVVVTTSSTPTHAPPAAAAPPSSCAAPAPYAGPRYHVEYFLHDQFEKIWDDRRTGADPYDGSFFHPIAPPGFFAVGSLATRGQIDHPHCRALVVREPSVPGQPHLLAAPTSFTKIWEDKGTGGRFGDCSLWWPNAPAGYVAVGAVAVKGYNQPHPDVVRCIHIGAVVPAAAHAEPDGHFIWCDRVCTSSVVAAHHHHHHHTTSHTNNQVLDA
jgi:hypothetical protein